MANRVLRIKDTNWDLTTIVMFDFIKILFEQRIYV